LSPEFFSLRSVNWGDGIVDGRRRGQRMGTMTGLILALSVSALILYPVVRRVGRHGFLIAALLSAAAFVVLACFGPRILAGEVFREHLAWIPQFGLDFTLHLDTTSWIFALLVTGAGALILWYCHSYFEEGEDGLARFASSFLGFAASMLGLVLADNVFLLFVFWEATTIFSFLLIGHSPRQRTSRAAALQALIVTSFGGLAMLVGLVLLAEAAGSPDLTRIIAAASAGTMQEGPLLVLAVYLVLVGALSKSAIFPFHFWLPGAMAAPTPVSAYLHAAAMVKAGVYLIARLGPGFGDIPGYRTVLVGLGAVTLIVGGIRALRQFDLKLIIAHSTVSQLGLLVMVFGLADPRAELVGLLLVLAHALAKAPLFLAVGVVDHAAGTRDLRVLSGLGRRLPALASLAAIAAASLSGIPPLLGFLAKEAALGDLIQGSAGDLTLSIALAFMIAGSALTVAYMVRFWWGAFATKKAIEPNESLFTPNLPHLLAPGVFALLLVAGGFLASVLDSVLRRAVGQSWGRSSDIAELPHLALWHGVTPALVTSALIIIAGLALAWATIRRARELPALPERYSASHVYWLITHALDVFSVRLTSLTQRGSLPFYLAVILSVVILAIVGAVLGGETSADSAWDALELSITPVQLGIGLCVVIAALFALRAHTRFQAVVLVGATGYGMAAFFALHGAPDLALTQAMVETVTLIAFVFVIRRLPQHIGVRGRPRRRLVRALIGVGVGATMGIVAMLAIGSRVAAPISLELPELAITGGHGSNVVNVMLVDIRGWDTLGELSVILAAATGVASLVFVSTRVDQTPKLPRRVARLRVNELIRQVQDPDDPRMRRTWLLAGKNLDPSRRSILLEVVVRLCFHPLILFSFYLLLTGHNTPGGGFTAGLVAGLALVARYLTGGREELGATVPIDAGRILGTGLALASAVAILPLFWGEPALSSTWIDVDLGPLGTLPLVTSTLFDVGVYLVVFGLILDVLRSLGAEIDLQESEDDAADRETVGEARS